MYMSVYRYTFCKSLCDIHVNARGYRKVYVLVKAKVYIYMAVYRYTYLYKYMHVCIYIYIYICVWNQDYSIDKAKRRSEGARTPQKLIKRTEEAAWRQPRSARGGPKGSQRASKQRLEENQKVSSSTFFGDPF